MKKTNNLKQKFNVTEDLEIASESEILQLDQEVNSVDLEEKRIKQSLGKLPFGMILKLDKEQKQLEVQQQEIERQQKVKFEKKKRNDKSAPIERDARKRVPKNRSSFEKKKTNGRDPRFDHLSGKLRWGLFQKTYNFISDMKSKEISILSKQIKKTKNPEIKESLRRVLSSNKDDLSKNRILQKNKNLERKLRAQNLNPNKTLMKRESIKEKFQTLQQKNKLDQFIQEKKKKRMFKLEKARDFVKEKI